MTLNLVIMLIRNVILLLTLLFGLTSCVDKFLPEINNYENLLVVDGLLTNGDEPGEVKLSFSSSVNNAELIPVTGGELYIVDEEQVEVPLTEMDPGVYKFLDPSFRAQAGSSYQLHLLLPNGRRYESDICQLNAPSPIDSVYGLVETQELLNYNHPIQGIQFYIDNHSDNKDTCYYLWDLTKTFEYCASFTLDFTWEGAFIPYPNPDSLRTCWLTKQVSNIFTFSTKNLDNPVITRFPLNYVSTESKELSVKYSLMVKQLSISEEAFVFWDALRQLNIEQGNLYSQQPIQIRGNVKNINNSDETVLGFFTVAGVTEKRIFMTRQELPYYYDICDPDFEGVAWLFYEMDPAGWPIYVTDIPPYGKALAFNESCFDCRLEGGTLTRPDFW